MKTSQLLFNTARENPAEAELISHKLMLRSGLIRKLGAGLYSWLPLGLIILRKVEAIVREELNNVGAQELLMPMLQPQDLWQRSQRWDTYGDLLFKLSDRQKRSFCLGPTHEEVVVAIAQNELKSYKQLPTCWYQIQTKFRDEIRPRFGVMRAREFLMKDGYSFHLTHDCLKDTYQTIFTAYHRIFKRLGLNFRAVLADNGSIGGESSHEFQVLTEAGEDALLYSDQSAYAANVELCPTKPTGNLLTTSSHQRHNVSIPGLTTTSEQAHFLNLPLTAVVNTYLIAGTETKAIALAVRGDHTLNSCKIEKLPGVAKPLRFLSQAEIEPYMPYAPGFIGPIGLPDEIPLFADYALQNTADFCCGYNEPDMLATHVCWERDCRLPVFVDLRNAQAGDPSPDGQGTLKAARGVEVGHIFQLGDTYTKAMNATVLNSKGQSAAPLMGCYGIGISRVVAACIEQSHDEHGIIWPATLAPFDVCLIGIGSEKKPAVKAACEHLYQFLQENHLTVLWDDRKERPGVLFTDMDLLGIPHRLVISEKTLAHEEVEYKARHEATSHKIHQSKILDHLLQQQG